MATTVLSQFHKGLCSPLLILTPHFIKEKWKEKPLSAESLEKSRSVFSAEVNQTVHEKNTPSQSSLQSPQPHLAKEKATNAFHLQLQFYTHPQTKAV